MGGWGWGEAPIQSQLEKKNTGGGQGVIKANCDWKPWKGSVVSEGHMKWSDLEPAKNGREKAWSLNKEEKT